MTGLDPAYLSFETPRVKARLLCEDDLDLYMALYTDPDVMRYIGPVMGREEVVSQFQRVLDQNTSSSARAKYWRISCRSTNDSFGMAALVRDKLIHARFEMGLMLLPGCQSSGIGSPVLLRIVDCALLGQWSLGAVEITTRHLHENEGGRGVMRSLGFDEFDVCMAGFQGWRMTAEKWREKSGMQVSSCAV
ncbi:MAG: GNAT family N-acetyltransferase [Xanthomonadaceae bacterium]|nr:GNAT family N-acetyltransferase [Xanthomonadaceae bacterium]